MGKVAFLFPGQGSQVVGMGRALLDCGGDVAAAFAEADQSLGLPLTRLMLEGPEAQLTLTENAQPALVTTGVAAFRLVTGLTDLRPDYVAGHSLGEYAAICAAGGWTLRDAVSLVRLRGQAMQAAVPVGDGAMAAMLNLEPEVVEAICREAAAATGQVCVPANYNSPGQLVISGGKAAVTMAMTLAKQRSSLGGVQRSTGRCLLLAVSAPFHSSMMQPAADRMAEALATATLVDTLVPVVANVTARPVTDAALLRRLLVEQITSPVRWEESIRHLIHLGVDTFVELGTGKVLSGLIKRIDSQVRALVIHGPDDILQHHKE